jgi:hypothetical protein
VPRRIDNQQARKLAFYWVEGMCFSELFSQFLTGEERGPDLLGDTSRFAFLHVGVSDFIEQRGLTSVHMAKNATDG